MKLEESYARGFFGWRSCMLEDLFAGGGLCWRGDTSEAGGVAGCASCRLEEEHNKYVSFLRVYDTFFAFFFFRRLLLRW